MLAGAGEENHQARARKIVILSWWTRVRHSMPGKFRGPADIDTRRSRRGAVGPMAATDESNSESSYLLESVNIEGRHE